VSENLNDALKTYAREVLRFAMVMNLTSVRDEKEFWQRFITPSLELLPWLPEGGRLLDIGSGMGIPGIPLLLARRGLYGLLVERRRKRAEFLRHLVRSLPFSAEVYDEDILHMPALEADVCVARAVAEPVQLLKMAGKHLVAGGRSVLPVARGVQVVQYSGWEFELAGEINAGHERQAVHVYKYVGGFT